MDTLVFRIRSLRVRFSQQGAGGGDDTFRASQIAMRVHVIAPIVFDTLSCILASIMPQLTGKALFVGAVWIFVVCLNYPAIDALSLNSVGDATKSVAGDGIHTIVASPPLTSRRSVLFSCMLLVGAPLPSSAALRLTEDGEYEEFEEEDWQTAWKNRLDKAQSMSSGEIFNAARGAGNVDLRDGEESDASKKRRAMSACRDDGLRKTAGVPDAKECNARVLQGEVDFMLKVL